MFRQLSVNRCLGAATLIALALTSACKTPGDGPETGGSKTVSGSDTVRTRVFDARDGLQKVLDNLDTAAFVLREGLLPAIHAKEVCSCYFVAGIRPKSACDAQVAIYVSGALIETRVTDNPPGIVAVQRITGGSTGAGQPALPTRPIHYIARYDATADGRYGCHLEARGEGEPGVGP